jgi:hypothetical protein
VIDEEQVRFTFRRSGQRELVRRGQFVPVESTEPPSMQERLPFAS